VLLTYNPKGSVGKWGRATPETCLAILKVCQWFSGTPLTSCYIYILPTCTKWKLLMMVLLWFTDDDLWIPMGVQSFKHIIRGQPVNHLAIHGDAWWFSQQKQGTDWLFTQKMLYRRDIVGYTDILYWDIPGYHAIWYDITVYNGPFKTESRGFSLQSLGYPQVTMGVNTKYDQIWMIWCPSPF